MPKKLNRQAVKSEVKKLGAFVLAQANDEDVTVQQDGDRTRIWVEGKEVHFTNED